MAFELFVALRYLMAKRKQTVISVISAISIIGIAAGVMALIIALALSSGVKEEIQAKILGATAHIYLFRLGGSPIPDYRQVMARVSQVEGVTSVAPTIEEQVLMRGPADEGGAMIRGIDPRLEAQSAELRKLIIRGSLGELARGGPLPAIVLGLELARRLGADVGDQVSLISTKGHLTPFGLAPQARRFRVAAIFESGLWDHDANFAYTAVEAAQRLAGISGDAVTFIECRVKDIYAVQELAEKVKAAAGPGFVAANWIDLNKPLFSAMKLEKLAMFVAIGLIVLVASLNIMITLIMMVLEKQKDIAILSAMGATERTVMLVFMLQGLIVGIIGTVLGSLLGISAAWLLDRYKFIPLEPKVYSIPYLPFRLKPLDFSLVALFAVAISFLATIYPARRAAQLNPVEALRYE